MRSQKKRLKALESKSPQEGLLLCEAQLAALEKAKADKEAHGEFESECPGYCDAQDTFLCRDAQGGSAGFTSRPSSTPNGDAGAVRQRPGGILTPNRPAVLTCQHTVCIRKMAKRRQV